LREAIDSVLTQTRLDLIDLVVSDNSESDGVENMMKELYPSVAYTRRVPPLKPVDHFRIVLSEIKAEYFILFHDDDVMLPEMVERLYANMLRNESACAIAPNAYLMRGGRKTRFSVMPCSNIVISTVKSLVRKYYFLRGVAPFPGYLYKSSAYLPNAQGWSDLAGKYSDVVFVATGLRFGRIYWIADPLMYYRVHQSNDSGVLDLSARDRFVRYFYDCCGVPKSSFAVLIYMANDVLMSVLGGRGIVYGFKGLSLFLFFVPLFVLPLTAIRKMRCYCHPSVLKGIGRGWS